MNKFFLTLAIAGAAISAFGSGSPVYVQREVLVKFKSGQPTVLPAGAVVVKSWPQIGVKLVKLPANLSVPQGLAFFKAKSTVQYAEPNFTREWTRTVSDPLVNQQYALTKIKAQQAWDLGTGKPEVVVAVLDSGFELTHVDMQGKFVAGRDVVDNDDDPTWVSEPHGVETAGCVAAGTNNGVGIAAIGFDCKVMPIRVGDTTLATADSIDGMVWASDHGAKVINMSYGGFGNSQAEKDATEYAWGKGLVVIASAGNHGTSDISYPAGYPKVIAVGASDENDQRANFSAFGSWVHVAAPGVQVLTTTPNNSYGKADGTSFSGPITAGLAGLLIAFAPTGTTNTQIKDAILNTCDPIGSWVSKGRINAFKAMQLLQATTSPGVIINPTSVTTTVGSYLIGDATSVSASDNLFFQVSSTGVSKLGQAAGAEATFVVPSGTTQISVNLEAVSGKAGGTSMVWLFNWITNQYVLVGSTPIAANGDTLRVISVRPNEVARYIGAGGQVKAFVRGHFPIKPFQFAMPTPFTYQIDVLQLLVR